MDIRKLPIFGKSSSVERPYIPTFAAMEMGLIGDPNSKASQPGNEPGVTIASGQLPNAPQAGLVDLGSGVYAFDHVRLTSEGRQLSIHPSSKKDVQRSGDITGEGEVVCTKLDGRLVIAAFVIDLTKNPWKLDAFRHAGFVFMNRARNLGIISVSSMDGLPEYEIQDIDTKEGVLHVRERRFKSGFGS